LAAKCLHLTNSKVEIPTTKTAIHPWITEMLNKGYGQSPPPLEEGSGMKPLLKYAHVITARRFLKKGREQGP